MQPARRFQFAVREYNGDTANNKKKKKKKEKLVSELVARVQ